MVQISLDNIKLSRTCPVFIGETDRTFEELGNYLDKRTAKVPFDDNFITQRKNIGQSSIEKIAVGNDNEIN
ncbi:MAG: hypothetical protein L0H53_04245 [Candidatus Nitrosocosmicus sp.]|nr:hypothetical protein [Candidatus Nitrosocosmicus sp.]MDN5868303.1 hypothetical protein [Candidatus Nitrosocosmicus sp.]